MVVPPSDWFWCGQSPLRPVLSLRCLECAPSRSQRLCVFTLALARAPLRWRVDLRTLFRGDAFGFYQLSGQGIGLSLASSQRHPGYMPGLALQWHFCALAHHTPQPPWLGLCRGSGDPYHSRELTFVGLIFYMLVFDHAYQP